MPIKEKDILFTRILTLHYMMQQSSNVVLPSSIPETPMTDKLEDLCKILKIESQNQTLLSQLLHDGIEEIKSQKLHNSEAYKETRQRKRVATMERTSHTWYNRSNLFRKNGRTTSPITSHRLT
jgi:hypothetical protein